MTEEPRQRLSIDAIRGSIEQIAQDPDNKDRLRALKMLQDMEASGAVLPDPLGNGEVVERLARLMLPAGPDMVSVAYRKAFPHKRNQIGDSPTIYMDDLSPEDIKRIDMVRSLKTLYKQFPILKGPGVPRGFPMTGSIVMKAEWCKRAAARAILEQRQREAGDGKPPESPIANPS